MSWCLMYQVTKSLQTTSLWPNKHRIYVDAKVSIDNRTEVAPRVLVAPTSCRHPCSCCPWRYRRRRPPPAAPSWPPSPPALSCPCQRRSNKPDRKRVSRNQPRFGRIWHRTNQARNIRGIESNRRDAPLAALLRGKPVLGPLGVGLPRRRALAVALPLAAAFANASQGRNKRARTEWSIYFFDNQKMKIYGAI